MIRIPKLSFCITCKNRISQIKKSLSINLEDNRAYRDLIEFVLVDFGSNDGLKDWILNNFQSDLSSGYLKYYYTLELQNWHASIAKNTSHLLATNELLVNLDCDNYTGFNGGKFVIRQFIKYGSDLVLHQFSGNYPDGTFGRIAISKLNFIELGGYDESFEPMGFQDYDLLLRASDIGLNIKKISNLKYSKAIPNSKIDSIKWCNDDLNYQQMNSLNSVKSAQNRYNLKNTANNDKWGIRNYIYNSADKEISIKQCECKKSFLQT